MEEIKIDRIIRSGRKTYGMEINKKGELIVRVPNRASDKAIHKMLDKKKKWILSKQELVRKRCEQKRPREFAEGEEFLYLGNNYKLYVLDRNRTHIHFKDNCFVLSRDAIERAESIFTRWYRQQAHKIFLERTKHYSSAAGIRYNRISIKDTRTRWGSCSGRDNLNFNWHLVMAPLNIIDYVVVHELSHIEEKNHSKKFWDKVISIMPDYKNHRNWLKENGHSLFF